MKRFVCFLGILTVFTAWFPVSAQWKIPENAPLLTRWAKTVTTANVLGEYPRPQMVRDRWMSLNGLWQYAEAKEGEAPPVNKDFGGSILVPFPIESALSGVMKHVERLWYRRTFEVPSKWKTDRVLLHSGAVDWEAMVFVNGVKVGEHRGGYDPFDFDITDALSRTAEQEIIVGVFDPTDGGDQPRGKQVLKPHGIWYTPTTGIWQTVWLEPVPALHISGLVSVPQVDAKCLELSVSILGAGDGTEIRARAFGGKRPAGSISGKPNVVLSLPLQKLDLWSPTNPFLYDLKVELVQNGKVVDEIKSYFGMRKIGIAKDGKGVNRIALNGEFVMEVGPLDQGFWPDGIYTAPTDDALRYDIEVEKKLGFNMVRKHVKVEPERWYYWTDKLGLLVWQDMPSGENRSPASQKQFETELGRLVETHRNHPSIIMWVVFNEGWGQYETERLADWVKKMDPSRLANNASGWTDKNAGDVHDIHSYPKPASPAVEDKRAIVLGEFGGLGLATPEHTWQKEHWGYRGMRDKDQLTSMYESFMQRVYALKDDPGLSAAVYTQTTDVETECNGLMTYDRALIKPDAARLKKVNEGDFSSVPPPPVITSVVPTSDREGQVWKYTFQQPFDQWYSLGFDDSHWQSGPGGFGTKETPGSVVRTEWKTDNIWLRREFNLNQFRTEDLFLWMHHDEDAEVYVNGVLAVKAPDYTSEYEQYEISPEAKASLKTGLNTIAIHCKQTSGGQYIDAGLVYVVRQ
jgi:hypothetical protein